jgi:hypothetical protein
MDTTNANGTGRHSFAKQSSTRYRQCSVARANIFLWVISIALCGRNRRIANLFFFLTLFTCRAISVQGQMNTGEIAGILTDPTGAHISEASVIATEVATQQEHKITVNAVGLYVFAQLPLGEYDLRVDARGFKPMIQQGTVLHGGDRVRLDFSLTLGPDNRSIVVQAGPGLMQVGSAAVKDVIENQTLVGLPLRDRQLLELTLLSPGVVTPPGGTRGDSLQQTGKLINVLGNRTGHNLFLVDGVSVTDEYFNNVATSPSPDATQEFTISLTDYGADFGGKSGGLISIITKSGTNRFHGSIYEFVRNSAFDAENYFTPEGIATPLHGNQFGAAVGGPIVKKNTFFFANYDGQRLEQAQSQLFSVPTADQRAGNLSSLGNVHDPVTKTPIPGNNLNNDPNFNLNSPSTAAALAILDPLPLPSVAGNSNNLRSVQQQTINMNQFDARVDRQISAADLAFIRASYFSPDEIDPFGSSALNEALLPGFGRILRSPAVSLSASEIRTFSSTVVNEFRLGLLIVSDGQRDPNVGNPFTKTYGLQGTTITPADSGYPQFNLSGLFSTIGTATGFNTRLDRNFEVFDNVSYQHGTHGFKFGGYFFHLAFHPSYPNNARGTYTFNGSYSGNALGDFLFGYPSQGQVGIGEGTENAHTNWAHVYALDNWQITPSLKANLGIRYEYNANLVANANQTSTIDLSTGVARLVVAGDPTALTGNAATLASFAASQVPPLAILSNSETNWNQSLLTTRPVRLSPRIGLVWQIPRLKEMVVRVGFGVFTNQAAYSVLQNLAENIPFFLNKTVNNTTGSPTFTTAAILTQNPNGAVGANGVNHDFKIEYNEVWNLSVQKAISSNGTLSVKYVGSRTVHADSSTAVNLPTPAVGAVQARRPFPNLNSYSTIRWDGWAAFNGLTVEVNTREYHGLAIDASYTLSQSIDDASDAGTTNAEFNLPQNIYANNLAVEKANSSFDHRSRIVGNLIYELPSAKGTSGWVHFVADGWELGGILTSQSGAPFTINLGPSNDAANIGLVNGNNIERPNIAGNPNAGPKTTQQWFDTSVFSVPTPYSFGNTPRNSVVGPGFVDLDASLQKVWALKDSMKLQLRADAYNLVNRPNFNLPGRIFGASNFGAISSASDPRQMQFAVKLIF